MDYFFIALLICVALAAAIYGFRKTFFSPRAGPNYPAPPPAQTGEDGPRVKPDRRDLR